MTTTTTHSFAGFNYPRPVAFLPPGAVTARLASWQRSNADRVASGLKPHRIGRTTGGWQYAGNEVTADHDRYAFYLADAGMPAPRYVLAHEVSAARIRHTGWYLDDSQTDTVCGVVFHLPGGRLLAGCTMGEGMASLVDRTAVYTSIREAANAADRMAEAYAEREREYQANKTDDEDDEDAGE